MSFGQFGIEFQGFQAGFVSLFEIGLTRLPVHVEEGATIGDAGIGAGITRIDGDGVGKHFACEIKTPPPELVEEMAAAQIEVIGPDVGGRNFLRAGFWRSVTHIL